MSYNKFVNADIETLHANINTAQKEIAELTKSIPEARKKKKIKANFV